MPVLIHIERLLVDLYKKLTNKSGRAVRAGRIYLFALLELVGNDLFAAHPEHEQDGIEMRCA